MLKEYIQKFVDEKKIPGTVIHVQRDDEVLFQHSCGGYKARDGSYHSITKDTIFDVASLTKVIATLPSILVLLAKGEIALEDPVQKFLPDFQYDSVSVYHLLHHNSGLPADLTPPVQRGENRNILLEVYQSRLQYVTGEAVVYSDLGMILLGEIIQKVSGKSLDRFVESEIFQPWLMDNTCFNPSKELLPIIASTEMVEEQYVQGEVHDEKAFLLSGVSGSAGLFTNVMDLVQYAKFWLGISTQSVIPSEWMDLCHTLLFQHRGLGFEVWSGIEPLLSCGRRWSVGSFGHTGFTGTSIWMDPNEKLFVVLLTNAVHYGRHSHVRELRLGVHDLVYGMYISN
ncbi:serine hydrolase domain-containing protein [Psychrobacillus psychrodurans]|uniref:serine hydrolase domain-containing protein n=1 Tax=Psychrobacillus psychrodurans TaxID=126157 RepID=UPI0008F10462|nr:serine hydrolase domain-containing protein [Psychrobacillus psychrodurans]MCZ8540675.1 beta-lactamase family protein [Psychrobacillus psychrodurans]SFM72913.1 CubicO group peptidase, beta-lactamase class C family [Psychrobacillus psychrodurans]